MSIQGDFKVAGAVNMPGTSTVIVVGLNKALMNNPLIPFVIRQGVLNALKEITELTKTNVLRYIGKSRGEDLYWTGALRKSVRGTVFGKAGRYGAPMTAVIRAGSSKVWYAYKVHELGRGWGIKHRYGMTGGLIERKFSKIKTVGAIMTGMYSHPPIPYMRLGWNKTRTKAKDILVDKINDALTGFMSVASILKGIV